MHDGTTFSLEISRVADRDLLKAIKIENDVGILIRKKTLRGYEILKIAKHFPALVPDELIKRVQTREDRSREFESQLTIDGEYITLRPPMNPRIDLKREIKSALSKKATKRHVGKHDTIVILDNLTTHSEPKDFFQVFEELEQFIEGLPFKSIWLYTGYYSADDGYECEYSIIPIKLTTPEWEYLISNDPEAN
jgi:hypothetical protein